MLTGPMLAMFSIFWTTIFDCRQPVALLPCRAMAGVRRDDSEVERRRRAAFGMDRRQDRDGDWLSLRFVIRGNFAEFPDRVVNLYRAEDPARRALIEVMVGNKGLWGANVPLEGEVSKLQDRAAEIKVSSMEQMLPPQLAGRIVKVVDRELDHVTAFSSDCPMTDATYTDAMSVEVVSGDGRCGVLPGGLTRVSPVRDLEDLTFALEAYGQQPTPELLAGIESLVASIEAAQAVRTGGN